jgi:drug/metabolite transporter (DMT)-like permease
METTTPAVVGIAVLFEPPGAAIFAGLLLHQSIPSAALAGMAIILCGLALVVWQSSPIMNAEAL